MSAIRNNASAPVRLRVWDVPTRLTHWLLAALFALSWWSAETHHMDYHRYSGFALLGVLVFRVYWGFAGSSTARFKHFVKSPRAVLRYVLKRDNATALPAQVGHNPLGALSVIALLTLLVAQVTLGLFAVDVDGLESGPLSSMVSFETGRLCAQVHAIVFDVLLSFIVLHVTAILFYLFHLRDNLIVPMITGWKRWHAPATPTIEPAPWWLGLIGVALAASVVWYVA